MSSRRIITLKEALKDFLREEGVALEDVLEAMDEDPRGLLESLLRRVDIDFEEAMELERNFTSRQLNLLILAIHIFYIANVSGYYKGYLVVPLREEVVNEKGKVTREGLARIIKSLGLKPRWSTLPV
ncbi:MAG: hypothetical protein DRJ49_07005 [Thermoprotei archaeon]|nr:MAG: hypothetical protein DRN53_05165 [Thermoprotei archaeon]RLE87013.1 MAG: hypothetical protein DRJ49_07005 [Thermoprotei archaeon]